MSERTMRAITRWGIPVALAVALLATSLWAADRSRAASYYETAVENGYVRAYTELAGVMEELSVALGKLQAVSAPNQTVLLLDDVWRLSGTAVSLMSQIPQSHGEAEALNRLLVQLGDFAHSLTGKAVRGVGTSEKEREQLDSLYAVSKGIAADLHAKLRAGDFPKAGLDADGYYTGAPQGTREETVPAAQEGGAGSSPGAGASQAAGEAGGYTSQENAANALSGAGASQVAKEESDYKSQESIEAFPTLIYDGPYSDSAEKRRPLGLGTRTVSEAEALEIAQRAAGIPLTGQGLSNGKIKSYEFSGEGEKGFVDVSVSVQGGHIVSMMGSASGSLTGLPPESEAARYRDTALAYLESLGYTGMQPTYAQYYGGCALINCAATQEGVILYSDLVKVWVDREDLRIVGLDARNYLFSHVKRELPLPAITAAAAESLLSPRLRVESRALALIPLTPETEVLCYEFKCRLGEDAYILYLNAQSGDEEQIFRIIDSEDGQMVL